MGGKKGSKLKPTSKQKQNEEKNVKKAKVKRSTSDIDFETLVKEEYTRLHRQYRLMENTRHAIAGASGRLSRQGRILSQLRDQKESILTDLSNATCTTYKQRDKKSISTILNVLERYENYRHNLAHCISDMKEMEENVDKITKRLVDQQLKVQAIYGRAFTVAQADHRKNTLENRLYHATTQFDELVSNNNYLKDEINMMLKFRGQVFRRLMNIKRFSAKIKSKMGGVVYEASQAYEARDDWVNKTVILRDRNDKDSRQHVLEIKEFQRVLHHDSKIHDFMSVKNEDRELLENHEQRALRKNTVKIEELNDLLLAYKRAFKIILKMSKFRDVEVLVVHYLQEEQRNYSVFKYVTDLNNEVNWLKQSIEEMKVEIEGLNLHNQDLDIKNELELQRLEEELNREKKEFQDVAALWKSADMTMEAFGVVLDQTFNAANCPASIISAQLGNSVGMRPSNICMCLSILERKITSLLFEKSELEVRKAVEIDKGPLPKRTQYWQPGVKPKPVGGPFRPKLVITGRMDTEQDDDDSETTNKAFDTPCYYRELKELLMEHVKEKRLSLGEGESLPTGISPSVMEFSNFTSASVSVINSAEGVRNPNEGRHSITAKAVLPPTDTNAVPPALNTTAVPPVLNTTAVPPVLNTTAVPPVSNTTTVPPVSNTTTVPPVSNTTTVPRVTFTDTAPSAGTATTSVPPATDNTTTVPPGANAVIPKENPDNNTDTSKKQQ